jgi:hypothetical protein
MLSVIMLSAVMLSAVLLSVAMLIVIIASIIMVSVVMFSAFMVSVVAPTKYTLPRAYRIKLVCRNVSQHITDLQHNCSKLHQLAPGANPIEF